jgi:intracellular sulfur oxidation DsrE/DsrF family protein
MKTKIIILTTALLSAFGVFAQKAKSKLPTHRIVMQLTSGDEKVHKSLTKQLNNLKDGWGDSVTIEVVCHGPGIDFLTTDKTKFKNEIYELKNRGIVFIVCENSLREREVPKEAILPDMNYVKMGIGEIVLKQEQGWTYIKAGF